MVTKRTKIGCALLAAPWIGIMTLLLLYGIISALVASPASAAGFEAQIEVNTEPASVEEMRRLTNEITQDEDSETDLKEVIGSGVNIGLGLFGVIFLLSLFVCTPLGIYYLATADKDEK